MRECKNICNSFEKVPFGFGGSIYRNGIKYCTTCNRFLELDGYRCLCCKSNVRSKSHSKKWKNLHRKRGLAI